MRIPFRLVDVFTDRPLAGNQLCVVPQPVEADAALMQAVAREIGFSETTFVTSSGGGRYAMRIFTPDKEMPFAGHPTLGTAFVLASEGMIGPTAVQEVAAGEFPVEVDVAGGFARMEQHAPAFGEELSDHERVAEAVGLGPEDLEEDLPPRPVSTGLTHLLVAARDGEAVRRAEMRPQLVQSLVEGCGADALYLFAVTGRGRAKARLFAPEVVLAEDPATGSAAGPLGAYLAWRGLAGMPGSLEISQGEEIGRPSTLHVEIAPNGDSFSVSVGGGVRIVGRGEFEL